MFAALFMMMQPALADDVYTIEPGDQIQIMVHRHQEEFQIKEFEVGENGEISFPYVGRVQLSGLTTYEARDTIIKELKDGYMADPEVTVTISSYGGHVVEIIGSVKKPGSISLSGTTTLRQVISQSGGCPEGSTIHVARDTEEVFSMGSSRLDSPEAEFQVQGGDVVSVMAGESVYLSGEVAKEGSIPFRRGITVSQALIESGGPGKFARLNAAYIVRDRERIRVHLKKILKGRATDLELRPGDRIIIPVSAL